MPWKKYCLRSSVRFSLHVLTITIEEFFSLWLWGFQVWLSFIFSESIKNRKDFPRFRIDYFTEHKFLFQNSFLGILMSSQLLWYELFRVHILAYSIVMEGKWFHVLWRKKSENLKTCKQSFKYYFYTNTYIQLPLLEVVGTFSFPKL
jgi:hypothetical protein